MAFIYWLHWLLRSFFFSLFVFQKASAICWTLSIFFTLTIMFGSGNPNMTLGLSVVYETFSRIVWSLGIAWLIIACLTNNGGKSILSAPFRRTMPYNYFTSLYRTIIHLYPWCALMKYFFYTSRNRKSIFVLTILDSSQSCNIQCLSSESIYRNNYLYSQQLSVKRWIFNQRKFLMISMSFYTVCQLWK